MFCNFNKNGTLTNGFKHFFLLITGEGHFLCRKGQINFFRLSLLFRIFSTCHFYFDYILILKESMCLFLISREGQKTPFLVRGVSSSVNLSILPGSHCKPSPLYVPQRPLFPKERQEKLWIKNKARCDIIIWNWLPQNAKSTYFLRLSIWYLTEPRK
jgi:hypothetical protein